MSVRLRPAPLSFVVRNVRVGWAWACLGGCKPSALDEHCRFNSCPTHLRGRGQRSEVRGQKRRPHNRDRRHACGFADHRLRLALTARSSIGSGSRPLTPERRVRFPHESLRKSFDQVVQSGDTRRSERRAHGYESSNLSLVIRTGVRRQVSRVRRHLRLRPTDSCLLIPISFLMTQADECPGEPHKLPRPGATPGPATFVRALFTHGTNACSRVRNPAKRPGREPGDSVGSTPTSATPHRTYTQPRGPTARHLIDVQETAVQFRPGLLGS